MSDDIESIAEGEGNEYSYDSEDQPGAEDGLDVRGLDDPLDEGYSPPEKPSPATRYGITAEEQREGESLDQHLAEEVPDPTTEVAFHDDVAPRVPANDEDLSEDIDEVDEFGDDATITGEVGDERSGRLISPDEGVNPHITHQEVASDAGIDGAGASAEEAAVHTVPDGQIP
ncbi:DUF5709 domain-containing protein [Williamsia sp. M5A3_1d]